jgi:hypothetical protein
MNSATLKRFATPLLVLLFLMPAIATIMIAAQSGKEALQYIWLQLILMGAYNVPFLAISLIGLLAGRYFQNKLKENLARASMTISIGSSVIGIIVMFIWGLGL